jgi:hypothetical protein
MDLPVVRCEAQLLKEVPTSLAGLIDLARGSAGPFQTISVRSVWKFWLTSSRRIPIISTSDGELDISAGMSVCRRA